MLNPISKHCYLQAKLCMRSDCLIYFVARIESYFRSTQRYQPINMPTWRIYVIHIQTQLYNIIDGDSVRLKLHQNSLYPTLKNIHEYKNVPLLFKGKRVGKWKVDSFSLWETESEIEREKEMRTILERLREWEIGKWSVGWLIVWLRYWRSVSVIKSIFC